MKNILFVGCTIEADGSGGGISVYEDTGGKLRHVGHYGADICAGYLCVSPDGKMLYVVDEVRSQADGSHDGGRIHCFAIDGMTGELSHVNSVPSCGPFPNYITIDSVGGHVLITNYGGLVGDYSLYTELCESGEIRLQRSYDESSLVSCSIAPDGGLEKIACLQKYKGQADMSYPRLQFSPHPHSVSLSPDDKWALVTDRGCEQLVMNSYDRESGLLEVKSTHNTRSGNGVRNSVFHKSLPYVFVVCELLPYVSAYSYNRDNGELRHINTLPAADDGSIPDDLNQFYTSPHPADIRLHPEGGLLAVSVRGSNEISVYRIDRSSGELSFADRCESGGDCPRTCAWSMDGQYLYTGNQASGSIAALEVTPEGKLLNPTVVAELDAPACLKLVTLIPECNQESV